MVERLLIKCAVCGKEHALDDIATTYGDKAFCRGCTKKIIGSKTRITTKDENIDGYGVYERAKDLGLSDEHILTQAIICIAQHGLSDRFLVDYCKPRSKM